MRAASLVLPALATAAAFIGAAGLAPEAKGDAPVPPWISEGEVPPPSWAASVSANSVEPGRPGELVLFSAPDRASPRRGVAGDGVSLPFFGTRRGSGCTGSWWLVGPLAWTCSDEADLSAEAAAAPERTLDASGLAAPYAFIQTAGASAYASLESAEEGEPNRELEAGWAVAIAEHRERWERTTKGLSIAQQDLHPARPSAFQGVTLALPHAGPLDIAWVLADHASVWPDPTARGKPSGVRAHFQVVRVVGEQGPMLHLDDGTWIAAADVARPHAVPPPALVTHPQERWIDVDLTTQTLVAYQGPQPVYATLVSTGRGPAGTPNATPPGLHRVWVKLLASDMANITTEDGNQRYSLEDVPYVQFFDSAVALHGTYWHGDFGHPHSHGCVNLSTLDARWLFDFTGPRLPAGWTAAFPAPTDPGTLVQVR